MITRLINRLQLIWGNLIFRVIENKVECNICGYKSIRLRSDLWHNYSRCRKCGSDVRKRLFWACLNANERNLYNTHIKNRHILHFAPEAGLTALIKPKAKLYETADLLTEGYAYNNITHLIDISDMPTLTNNSVDTVIALDVLEHVEDDRRALREIYRILTPNGIVLLTVPQKDHLENTYEDINITDPAEREKAFGQFDHLRIYGNDFTERMKGAGFQTEVFDEKSVGHTTAKKYVLYPPIKSEHPLATNYRKIFIGRKIA